MSSRVVLMWITVLSVPFVAGLPDGVVGCESGKDAVVKNFNIANYTQVGGGPLSDYNLTIAIDNELLNPSTSFDFEAFKDHKLRLTAKGNPFTEFLIRMGGIDEGFTVDSILPIEALDPLTNSTSSGGAKEAFICKQAYFVAGVSHDPPRQKSVVEMNLNMDNVVSNLIMDVSVIAETNAGQKFSEWYFSAFTLNAVEIATETPPPTVSPTLLSTDVQTQEVSGTATQSGGMIMSPMYLSSLAVCFCFLLGT